MGDFPIRKALVTGGGGFVGLAIVRQLRQLGVTTTVLGRNRYPEAEQLGACCLPGDIRDRDFLEQAVAGHDTVFHVAAKAGIWGEPSEYFAINAGGTDNVVAACRRSGVARLVYTSTPSVVFNGQDIRGGDERLPYARSPLCAYAASKILGEKMVLAANSQLLRTTALRPHLVWGPGDHHLIPRLLERGRAGKLRIVGNGKNKVDISYIDNVATAHIQAAVNLAESAGSAGQIFFISQGEPVYLWEWINGLFQEMGIPLVTRRVPMALAYGCGCLMEVAYRLCRERREPPMTRFLAQQLAHDHWFSIEKAKRILGFTPVVGNTQGLIALKKSLDEQKNTEVQENR